MKNIIKITLTVAVAILATACYQSDDNYKYKNPRPEITITGVEKVYEKTAFIDVLKIEPEITSTVANPDFEYCWSIYTYYGDAASPPDVIPVRVISTEKTLDYLVKDKPQSYSIELKVTNKNNGQEAFAVTRMNVTSEFSTGHYILKEIDGKTDMDLHTPDNDLLTDLLLKSLGRRIEGTPNHLGLLGKYSYIDPLSSQIEVTTSLNVATDHEFNMINTADMSVIHNHDNMFYYDNPPAEKSLFSAFQNFGAIYFSDQGVYFATYDLIWGGGGSGKFGVRLAVPGGCRPSKHVVVNPYYSFFFDESQGRFMYIDMNAGVGIYNDEDAAGNTPEYKPNNIPHKLLYFGRSQVEMWTTNGFAVMQDKADAGKRYLYEMTLSYDTTNPIIEVRDMSGTKFAQADRYAINELQARVIYFVVNNQLYTYKIDDKLEEPLTLTGLAADEEITYLSNRYWLDGPEETQFNYLAVGTYKGGNYKVYLYEMVGGMPIGAPVRILQGEGKMTFMQYVTPDLTAENNDKYPSSY